MRYTFLLLLLIASPVHAQSKLYLHNGSVFAGTLNVKELPVNTKYGVQKIPFEDVRSVQFGLHYDDGVREQISLGLRNLGSTAFPERDKAEKTLIGLGKHSFPFLGKHPDAEVNGRMITIRQKILEAHPTAEFAVSYDIVKTIEGDVKGYVELKEMSIADPSYGAVTVKLSALKKLQGNAKSEGSLEVQADGKWVDTSFAFEEGTKVHFQASGTVDLFPQTPGGQYSASPKGYSTTGKGGQYMAGALIAKIGNGTTFYIGDGGLIRMPNNGALQLFIVESPWNNSSSGGYKVNIRGE